MLVVVYAVAVMLMVSALPMTVWVSLLAGYLLALLLGFAWVTK